MSGDWTFLVGAIVLAMFALCILIHSLFTDRARGRRRCPECWYDLSESPTLTCSECGFQAKTPRRLLRTRRRWRRAAFGAFGLVVSVGLFLYPQIKRGDWPSLVPSTVMILLQPDLVSWSPKLETKLNDRLNSGSLWDWQVGLLWRRYFDSANPPWIAGIQARSNWPTDVPPEYRATFLRKPSGQSWFDSAAIRLCVRPQHPRAEDVIVLPVSTGRTHFDPDEFDEINSVGDLPRWREQLRRFGAFTPGRHEVTFALEVQWGIKSDEGTQWTTVWSEETLHTLQVTRSITEVMKPITSATVDEAIRVGLRVAVYDRSLRILRTFPRLAELGEHSAIGIQFELCHDDTVVARTRGWWGNYNGRRTPETLFWEWSNFLLSDMESNPDDEWSLRLYGVPELALLAFDDKPKDAPDADACWKGVVEIPLRFSETKRCAVPERSPDVKHTWEWEWEWERGVSQRN